MEKKSIREVQAELRNEALEAINLPDTKYQLGVSTYGVVLPSGGCVKVAITAAKVQDENAFAEEQEAFFLDREIKAKEAEAKKLAKEKATAEALKKKAEKAAKDAPKTGIDVAEA